MVFKDVIDNFIAPIFIDQPDGWDFIIVRLSVLEGTGLEHIECDSMCYQFDESIFNSLNYSEGWPCGRYDNYTIVTNRLILKPRDNFGRYTVECVLISPWVMKDLPTFDECLNDIRKEDVLLYNDVKAELNGQTLPFL